MKKCLLGAAMALAGAAQGAVYVDVETDGGTFTIEMDAGARHGGAAFLGLAEGWADWVDPRTGEPKHGERYYAGTAMGWVQKDDAGEALLLGNLGRRFTGTDGGRNWNNGAGWEWRDDIAGPTGLTARSVAMVQQNGPHSIDGCFAVFLQNADAYYGGHWSRMGTVVSNWGVVEALSKRETDGDEWMLEPATVTGTRVHGDPEEIAAWRAAAEEEGIRCEMGEVGLEVRGEEGTLRCRAGRPGRYAIASTPDLLAGVWNLEWGNWNEGEGAQEDAWPFSAAAGAWGPRRSFAVAATRYPELGGPKVEGRYSFRVEWERGGTNENEVYQYDLDVGAGTGMVWQLDWATQSTVLQSGPCNGFIIDRGGAHSRMVSVVSGALGHVPYYWLGEERAGAGRGRFRMWEGLGGGEVWGTWAGKGGEE